MANNFAMDGRENIALRGYGNQTLSSRDGSTIYSKFTLELRYPLTLKPSASIYALSFLRQDKDMKVRNFNPFNAKTLGWSRGANLYAGLWSPWD